MPVLVNYELEVYTATFCLQKEFSIQHQRHQNRHHNRRRRHHRVTTFRHRLKLSSVSIEPVSSMVCRFVLKIASLATSGLVLLQRSYISKWLKILKWQLFSCLRRLIRRFGSHRAHHISSSRSQLCLLWTLECTLVGQSSSRSVDESPSFPVEVVAVEILKMWSLK